MTDAPDVVVVRLLDVPVPVWERTQQQMEALQREFSLLESGEDVVPRRLLELLTSLRSTYAAETTAQEERLLDAADAGEPVVAELRYAVPRALGPQAHALALLLDETDEHCRTGEHLLTLAADPEVVRFRWWYLDQFTAQAGGQPAVAWGDYRR